jgi:Flp pilus assembly pilin Flp
MKGLLLRLVAEDQGQDLVEYALLTAVVALVCVAGLNAIKAAVKSAYSAWGTSINGQWESPAPSGS